MQPRWLNYVLFTLATLACGSVVAAETVIADVDGTRYPSNWLGGAASLTVKTAGDGGGFLAGITETKFPVGSLGVLDLDGYRIQSSRLALSGGISLGDAQADRSSTLVKVRLAVDSQLDAAWSVRLADQYIDLDQIHGHLVNGGVEYRPLPHWAFKAAAGYSVSGTLADRYGELAVHWNGADSFFGGVVLGRTGYDPANLGEIAAVKRLFQVYIGTALPVRFGTLNLSADTLNLEGASRQTLRIGFARPLTP